MLSPLSASVKLSGRIVKKYQRIRARSSPLNDNVRRRLLDKLGQSSKAVIADMNDQGLGRSKLSVIAVSVNCDIGLGLGFSFNHVPHTFCTV